MCAHTPRITPGPSRYKQLLHLVPAQLSSLLPHDIGPGSLAGHDTHFLFLSLNRYLTANSCVIVIIKTDTFKSIELSDLEFICCNSNKQFVQQFCRFLSAHFHLHVVKNTYGQTYYVTQDFIINVTHWFYLHTCLLNVIVVFYFYLTLLIRGCNSTRK